MQIGGVKGHAGILEPLDACFDARSEAEVELDIRRTGLGIGIPEAAGLEERRGDRTGPEQDILNPGPKCPVEFCNTVISVIARAFSDDEKIQVILKVSTDTRQIVKHLDAHRPQMVGRSYAGLQKQLRRSDCAGGDQYFAFGAHDLQAARGHDLDACRTGSLHDNTRDVRARPHRQVLPVLDRREIGQRSRRPAAVALRELIKSHSRLLAR